MNIKHLLHESTIKLKNNKIINPALDAEVLLAFAINKPKEYLFAHPEKKLTAKQEKKFQGFIKRRLKHEPIPYITNSKEFYGLDFYVDKNVLIPRPETETLVEEANRRIMNYELGIKNLTIIDIGTGSGCIAITLAKTNPSLKVFATDISTKALKIAKKNAKRHKVKIKFFKSNSLKSIPNSVFRIRNSEFLILANLPYLPNSDKTKNLKFEPAQALFTKEKGLYLYRQLFEQIIKSYELRVKSYLIIEIDPRQTKDLKKMVKKYFPQATVEFKKDLANRDRVAIIEVKS